MNINNNQPNKINPPSFFLFIIAGLVMIGGFSALSKLEKKPINELDFSSFIKAVKEKRVDNIVFEGDKDISGTVKDLVTGKNIPFKTVGDTRSELYNKLLYENNLIPNYKVPSPPSILLLLFAQCFPILLIVGLGWFLLSRAQNGVGAARSSITNLKAGSLMKQNIKVRFKDVAGVDEAKEELKEIVDFLKDPNKFTSLGGRLPKGALLVGPPGTGKTLLARAVAGEAGVPFFSISGSNFVEVYVGVGASRVRSLFEQAKNHSPCIVFIDEIDSIGRSRGNGNISGTNDEREQTLNQLLVEMDGFDSSSGIILIGATNRPDVLDPALLRPGRFDRRIFVSLPDVKGREEILKTHTANKPLSKNVNLSQIARGTAGLSGAELENLINEAAISAAKSAKTELDLRDFEMAKDKIIMGVERKSLVITNEEKKTTAYHEIGHTLISKLIKGLDPFHKVSIIPRGQALGITMSLPEDNRLSLTKEKAENMIAMLMGGRIAEELVFNHFTTGAANDLERANQLARRMVCEWGMSENMGPMSFPDLTNQKFGEAVVYSPETLQTIEKEVRNILQKNHNRAKTLLTDNIKLLHKLAKVLIEKETLDSSEIDELIESEKLS